MQYRRYAAIFALALVLISTSGCIYLRLLKVKQQLAAYHGYLRIENHTGLSLLFLEPVLLKDDFLFLAKRHPTRNESLGQTTRWHYLFEKRLAEGQSEKRNFDLPMDFFFQQNKLVMARFPVRFLIILRKPVIVQGLRALGKAKVYLNSRIVSGDFYENADMATIRAPTKAQMLKLLGKPTFSETETGAIKLTYRYRLQPGKQDAQKRPASGWVRLTFDSRTGALLKGELKFSIIHLSMDFRPPKEKTPAPRPTPIAT